LKPSETAYIALGANLGDRKASLQEAVRRLAALGSIVAVSSLYETDPVGYLDQPPFLNAVVELRTALVETELMHGLLEIEAAMGRQRSYRNAPRTLDLDLLLYGDSVINADGLTVPHPRLHDRAFVLVPLAEIAPTLEHPLLSRTIAALRDELPTTQGVWRVATPGWERELADGE
jgi:2-amino-4-hydroxy-6-hydroxymethyldihydropteridine diphosphokinase